MDNGFNHDDDNKDHEIKKFFRKEYDIYSDFREEIEQMKDGDDFKSLAGNIHGQYYKLLRKMMKVTKVGDAAQMKLIRVQENLESEHQEKIRALEKIEEQESNLRAIFDNAVVGIEKVDIQGKYNFVNNNFLDMLGYSEAEIYTKKILDVTHPDDQDQCSFYFRKIVEGKIDHYRIQKRVVKKNGKYFWVDYSVSAIFDNKGNISSIIGILVDIDERVKAELGLKESYKQLREAQEEILSLERKSSVLAMAVTANHEINQPLMIIKGNLEMLQLTSSPENISDKNKKYIARVEEAVDRIKTILDKFKHSGSFQFDEYGGNTKMVMFNDDSDDESF